MLFLVRVKVRFADKDITPLVIGINQFRRSVAFEEFSQDCLA
jgi:hypothetical protein